MLYRQIIIHNGMPFDLRLPGAKPVAIGGLSREELDVELAKGIASLKKGGAISTDEVDGKLAEELGI